MEYDIAAAAAEGATGVVSGALNVDGGVDLVVTARLVAAAKKVGMSFTFHRAIDMARDPIEVRPL